MLITALSQKPHFQMLLIVLNYYINSAFHFAALISIWTCSVLLAVTLKRNAQTRESKFGHVSTNVSQIRNQRVILFFFWPPNISTPKTITNIVSRIFESLLGTQGQYSRTYMVSIVIGVQINLCKYIILYVHKQ